MEYQLKDVLVLRLEATNEQRVGYILKVNEDGSAIAAVQGGGRVKLFPNGQSKMGNFTVIKLERNQWDTLPVSKLLTKPEHTSAISKRDRERDGSLLKELARRNSQQESEKP